MLQWPWSYFSVNKIPVGIKVSKAQSFQPVWPFLESWPRGNFFKESSLSIPIQLLAWCLPVFPINTHFMVMWTSLSSKLDWSHWHRSLERTQGFFVFKPCFLAKLNKPFHQLFWERINGFAIFALHINMRGSFLLYRKMSLPISFQYQDYLSLWWIKKNVFFSKEEASAWKGDL